MRGSWSFPYAFDIKREADRVIVRSQWGRLLDSIFIGVCFIAGLMWIMQANGMLSAPHWDLLIWIVVSGLVSVGLFIMLPRRLTVSFDCRNRTALRNYQFAFGLIARRREIPFNDIACIAVKTYQNDGDSYWMPIIRHVNNRVTYLAIKGSSRDEAASAGRAISSATGIAFETESSP